MNSVPSLECHAIRYSQRDVYLYFVINLSVCVNIRTSSKAVSLYLHIRLSLFNLWTVAVILGGRPHERMSPERYMCYITGGGRGPRQRCREGPINSFVNDPPFQMEIYSGLFTSG